MRPAGAGLIKFKRHGVLFVFVIKVEVLRAPYLARHCYFWAGVGLVFGGMKFGWNVCGRGRIVVFLYFERAVLERWELNEIKLKILLAPVLIV